MLVDNLSIPRNIVEESSLSHADYLQAPTPSTGFRNEQGVSVLQTAHISSERSETFTGIVKDMVTFGYVECQRWQRVQLLDAGLDVDAGCGAEIAGWFR